MIRSEEYDLREGLVYDPAVKGYDSSFWSGDTANLLHDTVKNTIKIGDTGLVGSASSFAQFLYGDFEFSMNIDSLSPDCNDSEKFFGLRNRGDTDNRGSVFFDLSYDTTAGDSSPDTASFAAVAFDEWGNRQRRFIAWDTLWHGGGKTTRFRIKWEQTGIDFLINDTKVDSATIVAKDSYLGPNQTIPQAIRLSNRSADTTDTAPTALKLLTIRNARKVI